MGLFGKKKSEQAVPYNASPFPVVNAQDAPRLQQLIDAFESSRTIEGTEGPSRALADMSGSFGFDNDRTIWIWFAAWCEQARGLGSPLTAVKIAEFTQTFHERYIPASGTAWMYLNRATDQQRAAIENAAFEACGDLEPSLRVRPDSEMTVGDFETYLGTRLGRVPPRLAAPSDVSTVSDAAVDRTSALVEGAKAGDEASVLHLNGVRSWMAGDIEAARTALEAAARLGSPAAMKDAGDLATEVGDAAQARFWYESGAAAGDAVAMFNMGAISSREGDPQAAARWFERAAQAGDAEAYGALTQLADDRGDEAAERRWARLGAEAGQPFCLHRHGYFLAVDSQGTDTALMQQALGFLELAGGRGGDPSAMVLAGRVADGLGDGSRAQMWYSRARETGDPGALEMLRDYGIPT